MRCGVARHQAMRGGSLRFGRKRKPSPKAPNGGSPGKRSGKLTQWWSTKGFLPAANPDHAVTFRAVDPSASRLEELCSSAQALLFDLDGTLADTMPLHLDSWQRVLSTRGVTLDRDRYFSMAGVPTRRILGHPLEGSRGSARLRRAGSAERSSSSSIRRTSRGRSSRIFRWRGPSPAGSPWPSSRAESGRSVKRTLEPDRRLGVPSATVVTAEDTEEHKPRSGAVPARGVAPLVSIPYVVPRLRGRLTPESRPLQKAGDADHRRPTRTGRTPPIDTTRLKTVRRPRLGPLDRPGARRVHPDPEQVAAVRSGVARSRPHGARGRR